MMKKFLFFALSVIATFNSYGQTDSKHTGRILDDKKGAPIAGITIKVPDLKLELVSDQNGGFIIPPKYKGQHLVEFSGVGYQTRSLKIDLGSHDVLSIPLSPSNLTLDEVIVTSAAISSSSKKIALQLLLWANSNYWSLRRMQ
ncbi:carboxypeptidase-like regulatory domain-containing protein [Sphingobacterium sp. IITKGP-BTPF85]|uniref:carboxypeptidase-like regulatory domain-containing protein n=1 Tax=Sphingobacterium sp. IITKGP-BTPF85 TaxID=1338009 RepID=UPI0003F5E967|nr:carboxypeptidase-like regulatory domain-containing protein [Sphingobacterium sp. IITKGP-BTPF85]KKX48262.1 hypothetical protein L950_0222125 [Sphingobacterium sp. IITKGP-BTPF85]